MVINELLRSSQPGCLHMLTDLLEGVSSEDARRILDQECGAPHLKYAVKYWLHRGFTHILPRSKLLELGIPKLDSLKYRIVGQNFALEQILSEIASAYANTELSRKPLVLLFAGPPGHGKSETAKQLADLLQAPFHKVDCRNHAHPWEMFGSGTGFIGSDSGSQLGNFMSTAANGKRSVVLLDEFDHCQAETWEAFYHIFEEGEFTLKKVNMESKGVDSAATRSLDCSKTIWLLTTNKFDNDIVHFNQNYRKSIAEYKKGNFAFDILYDQFEDYIRPKIRKYFQGGLTRRINSIVPFFTFDEEEAHVVTDMYIDKLRQMYIQPANNERKIGEYAFDVTNFAIGELSKAYFKHQLDGASAVVREVNGRVVKKLIHMRWIREEETPVVNSTVWVHHSDSYGGPYLISGLSEGVMVKPPYFLERKASAPISRSSSGEGAASSVMENLVTTPWTDPFSRNMLHFEEMNAQPVMPMDSDVHAAPAPALVASASIADVAQESHSMAVVDDLREVSSTLTTERFTTPDVKEVEANVKFVNVSVYFEDATDGVHFVNSFEEDVTAEEVLIKICSSLSISRSSARLWYRVFDDMIQAQESIQRLDAAILAMFSGRRAILADRSGIVGPWMYIRDNRVTLGGMLYLRNKLNGTPLSEGLDLLVETALPASRYSNSVQWARDKELNAWRNELKVDDIVDFLMINAAANVSEWVEGMVVRANREYDGEISVTVRQLGGTKEETVRCSSPRIQPLYSQTEDWRKSLKIGDSVDVRITQGNWQTGVIAAISGLEVTVHLSGDGVQAERRLSLYSEDIVLTRSTLPSTAV